MNTNGSRYIKLFSSSLFKSSTFFPDEIFFFHTWLLSENDSLPSFIEPSFLKTLIMKICENFNDLFHFQTWGGCWSSFRMNTRQMLSKWLLNLSIRAVVSNQWHVWPWKNSNDWLECNMYQDLNFLAQTRLQNLSLDCLSSETFYAQIRLSLKTVWFQVNLR